MEKKPIERRVDGWLWRLANRRNTAMIIGAAGVGMLAVFSIVCFYAVLYFVK